MCAVLSIAHQINLLEKIKIKKISGKKYFENFQKKFYVNIFYVSKGNRGEGNGVQGNNTTIEELKMIKMRK